MRSPSEALPIELSALLTEFARACKTAARSVSLYPGTHPAIAASLARIAHAGDRLTAQGDFTLTVLPDMLVVEGRTPARPDPAIGELAALLHERLVGALRIERGVQSEDWRALLLLLARIPEDLIAVGGLGQAWAATGRSGFAIREIDYAEVLRERGGADGAHWDRILAHCLQGESPGLDERALASLLEAVRDVARFGELLEHLQHAPAGAGATLGARAAALLRLLHAAVDAGEAEKPGSADAILQTIAGAAAKLTPEMLLALVAERRSGSPEDAQLAASVLDRMTDGTIASFVAGSVEAERGATGRLAQAFEALVPETERKQRLLELACEEVRQTELAGESGFEQLWQGAVSMLTSYSDEQFVSDEYARELSGTRSEALEVERVSDDPPDRVQAWLATVSDTALREMDVVLLLDLMRIECDPQAWQAIAAIAVSEIERRTLLGEVRHAQQLADRIAAERGAPGRAGLQGVAEAMLAGLAGGPLARHIVVHLRKAEDADLDPLSRLCHTVGAGLVRPLAEALAIEENARAIRRLRELLLGFGADGRQSVEQLKSSSNPAVRRTAIDLLRVFGGHEALPELASMLHDADPQVQRESIRAIVQIGTAKAYAVLERVLVAGGSTRDAVVQQLIGLRDEKAIPPLCYVLNQTRPRGRLAQVHEDVIEALGALRSHAESVRTLRHVLYRAEWWAPFRTAVLRRAAALALRRIGSAEALAILQEAAESGRRGVRTAARAHASLAGRRDRERT